MTVLPDPDGATRSLIGENVERAGSRLHLADVPDAGKEIGVAFGAKVSAP